MSKTRTILEIESIFFYIRFTRRSSRGVVANMPSCKIVVSEFELYSWYYIHFRERYELPYPPATG